MHTAREGENFVRNGQTALFSFLVGPVTCFWPHWPDGLCPLFCARRQCLPTDVPQVGKGPTRDVPQVPTISLLCQLSCFISSYTVHPHLNSASHTSFSFL